MKYLHNRTIQTDETIRKHGYNLVTIWKHEWDRIIVYDRFFFAVNNSPFADARTLAQLFSIAWRSLHQPYTDDCPRSAEANAMVRRSSSLMSLAVAVNYTSSDYTFTIALRSISSSCAVTHWQDDLLSRSRSSTAEAPPSTKTIDVVRGRHGPGHLAAVAVNLHTY